MSIEVSKVYLEVPETTLSSDVRVSQVLLEIPGGVTFNGITFAKTDALPTLVATATTGGTVDVQVAQVVLELPGTANLETMGVSQAWMELPGDVGARDITVTQTEDLPALSASMFDIVGQVNGGGTVSEGYPHRSVTATQTETMPALSAAMGEVGTLGPALITALQTEELPTLAFVADAQRTITAAQTEELPALSARIGERAPGTGVPGKGRPRPRTPRVAVRIDGVLHVGTYGEINDLVARLAAEDAKRAEPVASNRQAKDKARKAAGRLDDRMTVASVDLGDLEAEAPDVAPQGAVLRDLRAEYARAYAQALARADAETKAQAEIQAARMQIAAEAIAARARIEAELAEARMRLAEEEARLQRALQDADDIAAINRVVEAL